MPKRIDPRELATRRAPAAHAATLPSADDPPARPSVGGSFRVRVEDLRLKPNVAAGMDPCVLLGLVPALRGSSEDHEPIQVSREPDGSWRVQDGRHRFLAAVIAGRPDVLAVEVS